MDDANEPTPLTPEVIAEGLRLDAGLESTPAKGGTITGESLRSFWELAFHAVEHYGAALRQLQAQAAELEKLRAERDAAMKYASRMVCFGCGDPWSVEADVETCDLAHRETWGHEWVTPRVNELTALLAKTNRERDAARALAARLAEALHNAAPKLVDGRPCWCAFGGHRSQSHCVEAAAALAEARAAGVVSGKEEGR